MKMIFRGYVLLVLYITCALSVLGLFSELNLFFDLASNFRFHYAISGFFCLIVLVVSKAHVNAGISLTILVFNSMYILPWYIDDLEGPGPDRGDIKIFMNNVLTSNSSAELLMGLIRDDNPDIILLLETNGRWVGQLTAINKEYKYSVIEAREDNFGIALYSKLPIENKTIRYFGGASVPSVLVELKSDMGNFTFIATHPLPPINKQYFHSRNEQLLALAQEARISKNPLIIAGDLNATMWSSHYKVLCDEGGLRNARDGYGVGSTWPSMALWFGIPIDHIMVSEHFATQSFKVGRNTGSDHLPISVSLRLRRGS